MLEFEVLFILVTVAVSVLCYKCSRWYKVQFPKLLYTSFIVSSCVVGCVVLKNCCSKLRASTVKQGILYWTCTGLAVEVIGLVPTRD